MPNWKKVGVAKMSRSKKVVLLGIHGLDPYKWLIIDVESLLELVAGHKLDVDILEGE